MAVETDEFAANHCQHIGSCMSGCPRHAIFRAATVINAKREAGLIHHLIESEVWAFNPNDRTLIVKTATGHSKSEPFDLIFWRLAV
jgi:ferredoxin